jgi:lipoate-protein ligase A
MFDYPLHSWRLLITPPMNGAWNMAIDETLLESVYTGNSLPVLRLYTWEPPCLSLGYAQPSGDIDLQALAEHQWDLVRRPTGGRAILHTDELTYSVTAPYGEPRLEGGVLESYLRLSQALLHALKLLGLPVSAREADTENNHKTLNPVCFEVPSNYEITVNEKKLVGSAQARKKEGILQHGTLPLWGDISRITRVMKYPDEQARTLAARKVLERATTVEQIYGKAPSWEEVSSAVVSGFEQVLNLRFEEVKLKPDEVHRAEQLVKEKYGHPSWNLRL